MKNYFHGKDGHELGVFDSKKAKILSFDTEKIDTGDESILAFGLNIERELTKEGQFNVGGDSIQEDYMIYFLEKQKSGKWLIYRMDRTL